MWKEFRTMDCPKESCKANQKINVLRKGFELDGSITSWDLIIIKVFN